MVPPVGEDPLCRSAETMLAIGPILVIGRACHADLSADHPDLRYT